MSRVCVEAQRGRSKDGVTACVCKKYADESVATRLHGIVRSGSPLLDPRHPDHRPGLRTYEDLCAAVGATRFRVGSTVTVAERRTRTKTGTRTQGDINMAQYDEDYGDLPPIEDYGFGIMAAIPAPIRDLIPSTAEIKNMVFAGGGVVGALLVADQVIPRVPWLKDQNVYVKAGVKVLGAIVAGKLLSRYNGFLGGGVSAGLLASAVYDMLDNFVFSGAGSSMSLPAPAPTAQLPASTGTSGYGIGPDEQLFDVDQRLFADVDVMQPDSELSGESTSDIDIMDQDGPMYMPPDGSEGEMEGVGAFMS